MVSDTSYKPVITRVEEIHLRQVSVSRMATVIDKLALDSGHV